MIVTPIRHPLAGERLIGVEPPLNPTVDARWRRRLNLYTGRALSDAALTTEQTGRAGRLATRGQMLSPGIVNGLFVGLESPRKGVVAETTIPIDEASKILRQHCFFHISAGAGIMPSGEDLILSRNVRVAVGDVPVYTTVELLSKIEDPQEDSPTGPIVRPVRDLTARSAGGPAVLKPRRLGPPLIDLVKAKIELPRARILLLQPIILKRVGEFDDEDPCEQDPQDYAFEDWQLVDGWQLILYPWPTELTDTLPLPADSSQWRNQLAYTIFEAEMNSSDPRATLPWEEIGLPLGLVGFDSNGLPEFVDRYAVVRAGGKPKRRSVLVPDISDVIEGKESEDFTTINQYQTLVPGAGHPFVWQARLQQFAEQLAESLGDNQSIAGAADQFRFLPPAGLLPKEALTLDAGQIQNKFFPVRFDLAAVPVPLEQLDVAINQSASLSRFDTNDLDRLRVLVPVPQIYYEPNLLEEEKADPEFEQNIATSLRKLGKWMKRRFDVHDAGVEINREIKGRDASYPELELMSNEEREINQNLPTDPNDPVDPADKELNTEEDKYDREPPPRTGSFNSLQERLSPGPVFPRKILEGTIKGVAVSNMCIELGLEGFIDYLEHKVKQADDIIDFGFVRVQTNIYRYRQLMMGTEAARLATSPALAAIAKSETALATKDEIIKFVQNAKTQNLARMNTAGPLSDSGSDEEVSASIAGSGADLDSVPAASARMAAPDTLDFQSNTLKDTTAGTAILATKFPAADTAFAKQQTATTFFGSGGFTKADVTQQTAIVGRPLDFRTVTIAERIKQAPAPEAKDYTVLSKYEVLKALEELAKIIVIDDLVLPGLYHYDPVIGGGLKLLKETVQIFDREGNPRNVERPKVSTQTFGTLMTNKVSAQVLSGLHDFDPDDGDESAFFAAAVRASDHTVAMLRVIEGRIQAYRNIIADCRQVLSKLKEMATSVASRLNVIEGHLAEMRHDLAVARALKADEDLRVENINERRAKVLKEHVGFLAFCRERTTDPHDADVKTRELDPAMVESPVPACLARDVSPPPELHGMIDQLRDAPVKWFINVHPLLDRFDRLEALQRVVYNAKVRANLPPPVFMPLPPTNSPFGNFGPAIGQLIMTHQTVVSQLRVQTAQLDLSSFVTQSWQVARDQAREVVSLGDLIEGSHGRGDVSQQAARELANITHIASCLYSTLSVVLPVIRLNWAERISQFDAQVDLRNLGSLPRWGEIAYLDRREMQTYTDWLFSRIDRKQPEAISIINDTVRVCILLASHAPVNQIISAHVAQQTEVNEGGRVTLTVDPLKVRVGMHVLMYRSGQIAARGIIEDLSSSQAAARIVQVHNTSKTTSVDPSDYVQIGQAGAFDRNPLALVRPK